MTIAVDMGRKATKTKKQKLSYEIEIAFLKVKTLKAVIMYTTLLWTSLHNVTTSKYVNY